jgi:hypothetical protein
VPPVSIRGGNAKARPEKSQFFEIKSSEPDRHWSLDRYASRLLTQTRKLEACAMMSQTKD